MAVFICWSGTRSQLIADAVKTLLQATVPALKDDDQIFLSGGIAKGVTWFDAILSALKDAKAGIACVTAENVSSPWMHFEAGALAGEVSKLPIPHANETAAPGTDDAPPVSAHRSRLFTVLHGVDMSALDGPLSAYQGTSTTPDEMSALVRALRLLFGDAVKPDYTIPEKPWNEFAKQLRHAVMPVRELVADFRDIFQRKTFNEPICQCADQAWLSRVDGAWVTRDRLRPHAGRVQSASADHEHGLFEMLLTELDAYAMAMHGLLFTPREFRLGANGELEMEHGIKTACEDRRLAIRSLVGRLSHPLDAPLIPESVWFMAAGTDEERKMIIHGLEGRIRREREGTYEDVDKGLDRRGAIGKALDKLTHDFLQTAHDREQAAERERAINAKTSKPRATEEWQSTTKDGTRLLQFRASSWDLDRIYYYLLVQYFGPHAVQWESPEIRTEDGEPVARPHDLFCAARDVEMEIERYRARAKGGSLTPLTYALVALHALKPVRAASVDEVRVSVSAATRLAKEELADMLRTEEGRPIARLLADIW
jgi:hypothetical protein